MKSNILLIAQRDSSLDGVIAIAALEAGRGVRHATSTREAFEILADNADNIDVVILDLDPGAHSLSVLEALSFCKAARPIIVMINFEEKDMAAMVYRHGATACIARPFTAHELAALIQDVCCPEWQRTGGSCDQWGHSHSTKGRTRPGHAYEHVRNMSL